MERAIEKAWEQNLKELKNDQWESREALISNCCPYGEYKLDLKGFKDDEELCSHYHEHCTECWNTEIEEDIPLKGDVNDNFSILKRSPIFDITLHGTTEDELKESLKINDCIIHANNGFEYNEIPSLIKWLQDVYDYCTELKNKIEYVDWQVAREHMKQGKKAQLKGGIYGIQMNELVEYRHDKYRYTGASLFMLDSKEWILL